jgi:hypothetical protein
MDWSEIMKAQMTKARIMKATGILSVAVLGLIPTIMGTAAMADGAPVANQSTNVAVEALAQLKAQAAPDTTLLRPL